MDKDCEKCQEFQKIIDSQSEVIKKYEIFAQEIRIVENERKESFEKFKKEYLALTEPQPKRKLNFLDYLF